MGIKRLYLVCLFVYLSHCNCSFNEIPSIVDQMIGHSLVTKQTGKDGVLVQKVLIQYVQTMQWRK